MIKQTLLIILTISIHSSVLGSPEFQGANPFSITIATEGAYKPWNLCQKISDGSYNNNCTQGDLESGDYIVTGYDRELGDALCAEISKSISREVRCQWTLRTWDQLILPWESEGTSWPKDGLGGIHGYDMIIASMGAKPERKKYVFFTGPYTHYTSVSFIGLANQVYKVSGATKVPPRKDLAGNIVKDCPADESLVIGAILDSGYMKHVEKYCNNPIKTFPIQDDVNNALSNKTVDLIIGEVATSKELLQGPQAIAQTYGEDLDLGVDAASIVLSKKLKRKHLLVGGKVVRFTDILNESLLKLFSNGSIRKLQDKWEKADL